MCQYTVMFCICLLYGGNLEIKSKGVIGDLINFDVSAKRNIYYC